MPEVPSPVLRRSYPGLSDPESRLLRAYLQDTDPETVDRLRTQVRVGQGEVVPNIPDKFAALARDLSRLKIDAVVDRPEQTEVVELKSRLRTSFPGQLTMYGNLLGSRPDERSNPRLVGVGFRKHPDVDEAIRGTGIQTHIVPRADRTTASRQSLSDLDQTDG